MIIIMLNKFSEPFAYIISCEMINPQDFHSVINSTNSLVE